jgi:acyl-CoA thioesterase-1
MTRLTALVVCCLVANGAARAATPVPTHVACVGDSITAGYLASSTSASYPSVLQRLFGSGVQVKNFGHSGATLLSTGDVPYQQQSEYSSATTFASGAGASAVVDVVIMLGTNDSKPANWMNGSATRAAQFQTDCGAMVDHFAQLSTHPQVFLALPPEAYSNSFTIDGSTIDNQIIPIIKQVAAAKGVPIIDVNTPTKGHPEMFSDGVHPTDSGYSFVAQLIHDGLLAPAGGAGGAGGGQAGAGGAAGAGGRNGGAGGGGQAAGGGGHGGGGGHAGGGGTAAGSGGSAGAPAAGGGGGGGAPGAAGTGGGQPGTSGSGGAATGGTAGTPGTPPAAPGEDQNGCACATSPGSTAQGPWTPAMLLLGALLIRRRRRRS